MSSALERRVVDRVIAAAVAAGVPVPDEVRSISAKLDGHGATNAGWRIWLSLHPDADPDDPEPLGWCCYGVAVYGPGRCTCWEDVYDTVQLPEVVPFPETETRSTRCSDCAFRKDSPERAEELVEEELLGLAVSGTPFWCHDGMRRPVAYRHPVLGEVPADPADWRPPIRPDGIPLRRDGRPGLLCAGWDQERRRQARAGSTA